MMGVGASRSAFACGDPPAVVRRGPIAPSSTWPPSWSRRWWWLGCLAANVAVTAVMMWWLLDHPDVEQSLLSPDEIDQLVNNDFQGYYSQYAASHFAASVWVNIAARSGALG